MVRRRAYAKINLGLDVTGRRPDGYHEVRMIMQTVDICDELTFERKREPGIAFSLEVQGRQTSDGIPEGMDNLVCRAASLLTEAYSIREGVTIHLSKTIPAAAGMAGGSSDAAAVFHGMNELFELGMSRERMRELAVGIGADVPYCVEGGTVLAEGIGERLTFLPAAPECGVVVWKPEIEVSTAHVYGNLRLEEIERHPDIDGMRDAVLKGDLEGICARMDNVLESVTAREYPVIRGMKERMKAMGAMGALMSGSGPSVFGIWGSGEEARQAYMSLQREKSGGRLFLTSFHDTGEGNAADE